jgi:glycosyltransferase involved in cell wall biosynthesis
VIDDGSTDRSREIIESFGTRIRAVFKENEGQSSVYNMGLELAETEYVLFLDSDDVLYENAVSRVLGVFDDGDCVKVQFRLDVVGPEGARTGAYVPSATPPRDCSKMLRKGWLYPSPPASGNAYRVSALKKVFPIPMSKERRRAADFFAIYGVAMVGLIDSIDESLGGYRVHRQVGAEERSKAPRARLMIGNCEEASEVERAFPKRWETLREMVKTRLGEDLPPHVIDFSYEKTRFSATLYEAPIGLRWRWFIFDSRRYFHSLIGNPFWGTGKKLGVVALTMMCLFPSRRVSGFAIRYIANPLTRRAQAGR